MSHGWLEVAEVGTVLALLLLIDLSTERGAFATSDTLDSCAEHGGVRGEAAGIGSESRGIRSKATGVRSECA